MRRGHPARVLFPILFFTIFLNACSGSRQPNAYLTDAATEEPRQADGLTPEFDGLLAQHLALPAPVQEQVHEEAAAGLKVWKQFEDEAWQWRDSELRHWFYRDYHLDMETMGVGLAAGIRELKTAVEKDPTFAEAWGSLGRLCAAAGDRHKGREYLDKARLAALARSQAGRPVADDSWLEILRERAWVLRDLALWDEGLAAVDEGLRMFRGDRDLVLIKGLLLAGAGRYQEATSLAVRMEPFAYPQHDLFHYGTRLQTSDYANRWIRSQALLAVGDYELARHVIGSLDSYPYRRYLPHQQRFWNDVGLVAELAGDPDAGTYYAIGLISSPYRMFYPESGGNLEPLVLDVPQAQIPFFTSFGGRFHVGGSLLSYAASQMNMMSLSAFEGQRSLAAWRALEALNIAERRNIRPDVVQAMRGRVYFSTEDLEPARRDLEAAHASFQQKGEVDPGTSLLLGLLDMNGDRYAEAVPLLQESVDADDRRAVAWRTLGACLAHLGRRQEAGQAMDRALELEPLSVSGRYNRGLLHLQGQDFPGAVADLEQAFQLDPDNREVQRLLQMAAAEHRAAGGDPRELRLAADGAGLKSSDGPALTAEEVLARLEADVESFFAVPDSVKQRLGPADQIVTGLQRQWDATADLSVRKVLALAYLDRGMHRQAQELLAPGWGTDLAPEEEVMLLYADRLLGEQMRARQLADLLLAGKNTGENPYLLAMLPVEDRQHWTETILAKNHFYEGYEAAAGKENADAVRYSANMRYGFQNIRMAVIDRETGWMQPLETPFFRHIAGADGVGSATSGNAPVSKARVGNVLK